MINQCVSHFCVHLFLFRTLKKINFAIKQKINNIQIWSIKIEKVFIKVIGSGYCSTWLYWVHFLFEGECLNESVQVEFISLHFIGLALQ